MPDMCIDIDAGKRVFPGLDISPDVSNVTLDAANNTFVMQDRNAWSTDKALS
jgi:hypothetical protein